jgi:hypothetical protein
MGRMAMRVTDEAKRLPEGRHSAVLGLKRDDEWQKVRVYEPTTDAGRLGACS